MSTAVGQAFRNAEPEQQLRIIKNLILRCFGPGKYKGAQSVPEMVEILCDEHLSHLRRECGGRTDSPKDTEA